LADLLRQAVYSRLAGCEDVNDAERLSQDPTFRLIGSEKLWNCGAALTSRLQAFATEMLAEKESFQELARSRRPLQRGGTPQACHLSGFPGNADISFSCAPIHGAV
jgi:hypothetical protein